MDRGTHVHIRVENGAKHGSADPTPRTPHPLAGPTLRLEREIHRLRVAQRTALLFFEEVQCLPSREAAHLLESPDRYQRCQGLALAFDDELVVSKSDAVSKLSCAKQGAEESTPLTK
jgi:hypothetical protein